MGRRSYAGGARKVQLTSPIGQDDVLLPVGVPTGWPDGADGPFSVVINKGGVNEEKVLCSEVAGGFLTAVTRGYDGTAKANHDASEEVQHVGTSIDFDESNEHVNLSTNVHGLLSGDRVVGELRVATLKGKTLSGLDNTFTNIPRLASPEIDAALGSLAGADVTLQSNITTEANSRTSADAAEATARQAADAVNAAAIAAEASTRQATDLTLAPQATTYTKAEVDNAIAVVSPNIASADVVNVSSQPTTSGTTELTIATLGPFTFDGVTKVDLEYTAYRFDASVANDLFNLRIKQDGVAIATRLLGTLGGGNFSTTVQIRIPVTPTVGAHTFTVTIQRSSGTGTFQLIAAATTPAAFTMRPVYG